MKTTEVRCDECDKLLFNTKETRKGAVGVIAQQKGYIYKNACLFSEKYSSLFFCNHECGKSFYQKNIKPNKEVSNALSELKKDIPQMAKEVTSKMDTLVKHLNKVESR